MARYAVTRHGEHDPGCRYDFKGRAERVIQDSPATSRMVARGRGVGGRLPGPVGALKTGPDGGSVTELPDDGFSRDEPAGCPAFA
jgi:hypothetical protein